MTDAAALHALTREYLMQRHQYWSERYAPHVPKKGRHEGYSDAAKDIYPRYLVLQAILDGVERSLGDDFSSLEEARQGLIASARTAEDLFTEPPMEPIEQTAMEEERSTFISYLNRVGAKELSAAPTLPYRRTLREDEVERWLGELARRWGVVGRSWYPMEGDRPVGVEVFDLEQVPAGTPVDILDRAVARRGVERAFEIREWGPSREADTAVLELSYNFAEGLFFDASLSWLVFASYSSTVTVGGDLLLQAVFAEGPEWRVARWSEPSAS